MEDLYTYEDDKEGDTTRSDLPYNRWSLWKISTHMKMTRRRIQLAVTFLTTGGYLKSRFTSIYVMRTIKTYIGEIVCLILVLAEC